MLDAKAREVFDGVSRFAGTVVGRSGISPNLLTVAGVGITALASWQVIEGRLFVAACILAAGSVFDFLDGSVARATGKTSAFGAFLDSVTDRVSDALILAALSWAALVAGDRLLALLALICLIASQLVSYVRAKAESLGLDCHVGLVERAERILLLIAGLGLSPVVAWAPAAALALLAAGSAFTVAQRIVHVHGQVRPAR